ncbi:CDP-glycerol glycerophosphotransferase family protein [Faecalibacillus intestinalis]
MLQVLKILPINLSKYDDITEIYLISDICITDYSSVFFDLC